MSGPNVRIRHDTWSGPIIGSLLICWLVVGCGAALGIKTHKNAPHAESGGVAVANTIETPSNTSWAIRDVALSIVSLLGMLLTGTLGKRWRTERKLVHMLLDVMAEGGSGPLVQDAKRRAVGRGVDKTLNAILRRRIKRV